MTLGQYLDELFAAAAGALRWPPEVIMTTPIGQLELAIGGAWDFALDSNPWVKRAPPPQSRAEVARNARAWLGAYKAAPAARRRK